MDKCPVCQSLKNRIFLKLYDDRYGYFKIINNKKFDIVGGYNLKKKNIFNIYMLYIKTIKQMIDIVHGIDPNFNYGYYQKNLLDYAKLIVRIIKRYYFIINLE